MQQLLDQQVQAALPLDAYRYVTTCPRRHAGHVELMRAKAMSPPAVSRGKVQRDGAARVIQTRDRCFLLRLGPSVS